MDNKLSELSKPSTEVVSKFGDPEAFGERELKVLADIQKLAYDTKFYSQEYVSALREDAAKWFKAFEKAVSVGARYEERIAELELDELAMQASSRAVHEAQENHINQQQDRIDSLEKTNAGLGRGLAAAEQKLATPVRLPTEHELHQVACSECAGNCLELVESTVRAAGFTVEGDEQ